MAEKKTDYQKLQGRAKKLDIPANQSAESLEAAIKVEEKKRAAAQRRESSKDNAAGKARGSSDESRTSPGPDLSENGGVTPEWHNDPERTMGLDEQRRIEDLSSDWKGRGKVEVSTFVPQTHNELTIDFTELRPNTDFEVRISGPVAQPWWGTLKSDDWGQAQLIWRTQAGGDYKISAKGPGIDVKGEFSVGSYDADAEYRAAKRAARKEGGESGEAVTGSVATVEDPSTMGEDTEETQKNQPTDEELQNPEQYEPQFQTAKHDPDDQGDPTINKEPHPDGSAQFNYREPGEPETPSMESKESPDGTTEEEAAKVASEETEKADADADRAVDDETGVSDDKGMSPPMSQEDVDRENAQTGSTEAGKDEE